MLIRPAQVMSHAFKLLMRDEIISLKYNTFSFHYRLTALLRFHFWFQIELTHYGTHEKFGNKILLLKYFWNTTRLSIDMGKLRGHILQNQLET